MPSKKKHSFLAIDFQRTCLFSGVYLLKKLACFYSKISRDAPYKRKKTTQTLLLTRCAKISKGISFSLSGSLGVFQGFHGAIHHWIHVNDLNDLLLIAGCFLDGGTFTLPSGNFSKETERNDDKALWSGLITLQGINISHLGKRKIIFKMPFLGDMLVPWRVTIGFP